MTAPSPSLRDKLAEALIDARLVRWREVEVALEYVDALLPVVQAAIADALLVEACPACEGVTGHWHCCGYGLRGGLRDGADA